ncbi:glycosyltransferase family 4 protein [bacterium]|nr:glycosyltransferase family 4 protein [bacterium]
MERLGILHLAANERWTGVADPVVSLLLEQEKLGHRVWLACRPGRSFARIAARCGVALVPEIRLSPFHRPLRFLSDVRALRRFCRENRIDVVHCHLAHDHWLAAAAWRRLCCNLDERPLLIRSLHQPRPARSDALHRRLFRRGADGLICPSENLARKAEQMLGLPAGSVESVPGAVDLDAFHPDVSGRPLRKQLGIPREAVVAGLVTRMKSGRGLDWLLDALPRVLSEMPDVHFVVVGRGELKEWFKRRIRKTPFAGRVHYAGYRTVFDPVKRRKPNLPAAYAGMDLTLFLGLGSDGSCRAILEAMASGRPTLGLDVDPVREIIRDGETGWLARPGDAADLAGKLLQAMKDRNRLKEMGQAARTRAEAEFSPRSRAERVLAIYERHRSECPTPL